MASDFTELIENAITCPICAKHFAEPRMLPYNPDTSGPRCARCQSYEAEFWCDGNCQLCLCFKCWEQIHALGEYRNHAQLPVSERPIGTRRCQEHDEDNKLKYWCEGLQKWLICCSIMSKL
ncbi:unnamed protein product [Rotaria sp. Silwood1]|nr:unnamed protein product [Rotaria sp. Silwood1]